MAKRKKVAAIPAPAAQAPGGALNAANPVAAAIGKIAPPSSPTAGTIGAFSPDGVLSAYNSAFQAAKQANEQRYGDTLKGYGNLAGSLSSMMGTNYADALKLLSGEKSDALAQLQGGYDRNKALMANMGAQEGSDLRESWRAQGENARQRLAEQGMLGTTVAPTMAMGVQREANNDAARLNERLRREQSQVEQFWNPALADTQNRYSGMRAGLTGDYQKALEAANMQLGQGALGFMERRTDEYPDLGVYASILNKLGEGGTGLGAASGGAGGAGGGAGGEASNYYLQHGTGTNKSDLAFTKDPVTGKMIPASYIQHKKIAGYLDPNAKTAYHQSKSFWGSGMAR